MAIGLLGDTLDGVKAALRYLLKTIHAPTQIKNKPSQETV
jgi:hypothetical protein